MLLALERPLVFLDLESTGLDPRNARIVALLVIKLEPDGQRHERRELVNPGVLIPPGATAVHGIGDADVAGQPPFRAYARALYEHIRDCDLAGFGIERFDLPLLRAEFARAGLDVAFDDVAVIDAMVLFHRQEPRDLRAAHRRFAGGELPEGGSGAAAALAILEGQLRAYAEVPRDVPGLDEFLHPANPDAVDSEARFVWGPDGEALINFGRHRGERLTQVAEETPDYLQWVASNAEFPAAARLIAGNAARGEFPERPPGAADAG